MSPCALAASIAANRSCRKSERSSQFPLTPKRCLIVFPLPDRQTQPGGTDLRDTEQLDRHPSSREGTRIAGQPFCPREPRVGPLCPGKGRRRDSEAGRGGRFDLDLDALMAHQLDARPSVLPTAPVTKDEWVQTQRPMDATAHLPGAASWWRSPAIDTARAGDRDGNSEDWPHRRRAGSHRLLCVAHGHEAPGQQDTAASHRAGEESLDQRSGPRVLRKPT